MPIHGTIEEAGLPDVLQLLALGRKSGCLSVAQGDVHGEIFLDVGRISYASVANRDRLGELLVKNGRITREQLNEATAAQKRGSDRQLGKLLLATGSVDRADIETYVRHQVEEAVYHLFAWKQGTFTFTSDRQPGRGALLVSLDPAGLLLEGARRVDEWAQIERKIPSFDLVYQRTKTRTSGELADDLTEDQKLLLPLLDGTIDVAGLIETTGMSDFDVGKALYGLIVAGIARLVERRSAVRHLDYRELLAYVVREAELADPQRRKAAARHIVDCPDCSARLRTIHVRQTEGRPAVAESPPADAPSQAVTEVVKAISPARESIITMTPEPQPFEPDDLLEEPAAPTTMAASGKAEEASVETQDQKEEVKAAWAGVERRQRRAGPETPEHRQQREQERRAGRERRQRERRAQTDRRDRTTTRAPGLTERRRGPRRAIECGDTAHLAQWDRRAFNRRGGTAAQAAQPQGLPRHTEARRMPAAARVEPVQTPVQTPVPTPVQTPAPPVEQPTAQPTAKPVQKELPWLTTPHESLVMIRESRALLPPKLPPVDVPRTTTTPPGALATPVLRPVTPRAPAPPAAPRIERRPAAPPPFDPYATMPMAVGSPPRIGNGATLAPPPKGIFIEFRQLVLAASIAAVALLSYFAGSSRRGQAAGAEAAANAPAEPAPAAASPTHRPASARLTDTSPTTPLAAQNPPRSAHTAGAPVQPPASRAAAPGSGASAPAQAPTTTAAAAPAPVTTSAPPATQPAPAPAPTVTTPPAAPAVTPTITAAPPAEPDRELTTGGWSAVDRAEAITIMGGSIGAIQGLPIESITRSVTGSRPRVRVVQLTAAGERIVLTETRSGSVQRTAGPAVVTAVRVMPPSEAYPFATGTVSLGNLLVTAKTSISAEALRPLLDRMGEIQ